MLPCGGSARDQHHAVADRDQTSGADAERRIADLETVRRNVEARRRGALGRAVGVETNPRTARERLDRHGAEREAVADLAEHLPGAAVIARGRAIEEAGERDGAGGVDVVERIGAARAQVERAKIF